MSTQPVNVEPIPAGLTREQVLDLYYHLALTRALEERLVNLDRQGKVIGGLYRSLGQEGESVAAAYALQSGDIMSPLLRNLGAMLVMGARPIEVLRHYMAKGTGPTVGREMNVHFNDLDLGYLGFENIVVHIVVNAAQIRGGITGEDAGGRINVDRRQLNTGRRIDCQLACLGIVHD